MELKDFVTQPLVQIVNGIKQANKELAGIENPTADNKAFLLFSSVGEKPKAPHVEFDVAVSTKADNKATGGASAKLYVVSLEAGGSTSTIKENV